MAHGVDHPDVQLEDVWRTHVDTQAAPLASLMRDKDGSEVRRGVRRPSKWGVGDRSGHGHAGTSKVEHGHLVTGPAGPNRIPARAGPPYHGPGDRDAAARPGAGRHQGAVRCPGVRVRRSQAGTVRRPGASPASSRTCATSARSLSRSEVAERTRRGRLWRRSSARRARSRCWRTAPGPTTVTSSGSGTWAITSSTNARRCSRRARSSAAALGPPPPWRTAGSTRMWPVDR